MSTEPPPDPHGAPVAHLRLTDGTLPAVERQVATITSRLISQSPRLLRCAHLHSDDTAIACAAHPTAGLLCPACAADHTGRHSHELETTCDICGHLDDAIRTIIAVQPIIAATITPGGQASLYAGPVDIVCIGTCGSCSDAAGLPEVIRT